MSNGLGKASTLELANIGDIIIGGSRSQDKIDSLQTELTSSSSTLTQTSSSIREIKHL